MLGRYLSTFRLLNRNCPNNPFLDTHMQSIGNKSSKQYMPNTNEHGAETCSTNISQPNSYSNFADVISRLPWKTFISHGEYRIDNWAGWELCQLLGYVSVYFWIHSYQNQIYLHSKHHHQNTCVCFRIITRRTCISWFHRTTTPIITFTTFVLL